MKVAVSALLVGSAAAFQAPTMTFSLGKQAKVAGKKAKVAVKKALGSGPVSFTNPSAALPFAKAPETLDGSLVGDFGFDPIGFSAAPFAEFFDKQNIDNTMSDLGWLREAELMNGRIAQVAVLGFIVPALFGTLPGNEWTGVDAYSNTNPVAALYQVPGLAIVQIVAFMSFLEFRRINIIREEGAAHMPGDLKLGQGEGRYNPFGLNYTPEEYEEKQLQELKHCRLAMFGAIGLLLQAANSGVSVVDQLSAALTTPDYYAKVGYFFPEGI